MNDFQYAKLGDRVWDYNEGWGRITKLHVPTMLYFYVDMSNGISGNYGLGGIGFEAKVRTLFWDEVKIEPPSKPEKEDDSERSWGLSDECVESLAKRGLKPSDNIFDEEAKPEKKGCCGRCFQTFLYKSKPFNYCPWCGKGICDAKI